MKISYAITVCNEHKEIEKLLTFLFEHKRKEDQVVVQMDKDNATEKVWDVCETFEKHPDGKIVGCVKCNHGRQNHDDEWREAARKNEEQSQKRDVDFG